MNTPQHPIIPASFPKRHAHNARQVRHVAAPGLLPALSGEAGPIGAQAAGLPAASATPTPSSSEFSTSHSEEAREPAAPREPEWRADAKETATTGDAQDEGELEWEWASDLPWDIDPDDQLIENLLERRTTSVLYGNSNSGKTFLAIDLCCAIGEGASWMGRRTVRGLAVYLATESPRSVRTRLQTWRRHFGRPGRNVAIVKSPVNLFDGTADASAVVRLIRKIEAETGVKCELVVCDTLARMAVGANENSGEDMTVVINHAEYIKREARVHLMLIHHCGKDQARGARGWSGLRAAIDTEIEIIGTGKTEQRGAEITKQRDLPGNGDVIGFRLQSVMIGKGQWGQSRTSCVVVPADAPVRPQRGKRTSEIAEAISQVLLSQPAGLKRKDLVDRLAERHARTSVYKEINKLLDCEQLIESAGAVKIPPARVGAR